jgi:hypothetical protein
MLEANLLVCTSTEDALRDCVECAPNNTCVRHRPVSCP